MTRRLGMYGLHLFIVVQTIIWSIISILWFLVDSTGSLTHRYGARPWSRVLLWASRVKVETHGLENLERPEGGPMVLVCNHQSLFDILALLSGLPLDFKFVVKKELAKVPLWGYAMKKAGYIFVDRGQSGQAGELMRTAVERIKKGSAVLFFAEGTRSADGRLGEFKRGPSCWPPRPGPTWPRWPSRARPRCCPKRAGTSGRGASRSRCCRSSATRSSRKTPAS